MMALQRDAASRMFFNIVNFEGLTADPSPARDGDIWFRSDLNKFRQKKAGEIGNMDGTFIDAKDSCLLATTANIVDLLAAAPNSVDSVTVVAGNRILVKDQSTGAQNGIYTVVTVGTGANGVWARATDANESADVTSGLFVYVEAGTANAQSKWTLTTLDPITLGTTALVFAKIAAVPSAITGVHTITGGASGAVATFATTNGVITAVTLVP